MLKNAMYEVSFYVKKIKYEVYIYTLTGVYWESPLLNVYKFNDLYFFSYSKLLRNKIVFMKLNLSLDC